ncbi:MAG: hypothetical protein WBW71_02365, partial [Bacteroidota bacterium]
TTTRYLEVKHFGKQNHCETFFAIRRNAVGRRIHPSKLGIASPSNCSTTVVLKFVKVTDTLPIYLAKYSRIT